MRDKCSKDEAEMLTKNEEDSACCLFLTLYDIFHVLLSIYSDSLVEHIFNAPINNKYMPVA